MGHARPLTLAGSSVKGRPRPGRQPEKQRGVPGHVATSCESNRTGGPAPGLTAHGKPRTQLQVQRKARRTRGAGRGGSGAQGARAGSARAPRWAGSEARPAHCPPLSRPIPLSCGKAMPQLLSGRADAVAGVRVHCGRGHRPTTAAARCQRGAVIARTCARAWVQARPEHCPQKQPKTRRPVPPARLVASVVRKTAPPKGALRGTAAGPGGAGADAASGEWEVLTGAGPVARTEPQQAPCGERCSV